MRINFISGTTIIGTIYDEFNIKSDDWINRVPNWIYKALKALNNSNVFIDYYNLQGQFENNKIFLPEFEGAIKLLSVNGTILINNDNINLVSSSANNETFSVESDDDTFNTNNALSRDTLLTSGNTDTLINYSSYYIQNRTLYTKYNNGTYKLWYKAIPIEFNDKFQNYIPYVPDLEPVIDNIKWFVFKNLLSRGYIHPIYSLGNRNPEYDPAIQYKISKKGARIALDGMDFNDRNEIANVNMAFLTKPSYETGQVYNLAELFKENAI